MCEGSFLPSSFGPHQKHTEFESSLRSYPINSFAFFAKGWVNDDSRSSGFSLLCGFDRELQSHCFGHEGGTAGISVSRKGAVQALALNAGGFGDLGNAASRSRDATQGDQEHTGFVGILQCGAEAFSGELRTLAQLVNCGFIVRYACLAFHGVSAGRKYEGRLRSRPKSPKQSAYVRTLQAKSHAASP